MKVKNISIFRNALYLPTQIMPLCNEQLKMFNQQGHTSLYQNMVEALLQ